MRLAPLPRVSSAVLCVPCEWAVKLLTAKLAKKGRKERKEILPNISLESAGSLIHRPNQRCHLPAIAIEFTFYLPPKLAGGKIIRMTGSFAAADVNFLPLQLAVFCVECELLSGNNTPRCLACGSKAILSLSRVLGGSLRGQPTAHLIADAELDRLVRSLLHGIPQVPMTSEYEAESLASAIFKSPSFTPAPAGTSGPATYWGSIGAALRDQSG